MVGSGFDPPPTGAPLDTPAQAAARREMVERQLRARDIHDPRVLTAMGSIPRQAFVPADQRGWLTATAPCRSAAARQSHSHTWSR